MNGGIEFRFWNLGIDKMEYDLLEQRAYFQVPFGRIDLIPLQFTGFLDKNGKKIYNGDVLNGDYYDEVFWDKKRGQWMLRNNENPNEELWEMHNNGETEVIGNIYENPELLNYKINKLI
jgi:uncharacterized phage protein (TIGR01671 family)